MIKQIFTALLGGAMILTACTKDEDVTDPHHAHDEEVITSLILTFTDSAGVEILKTAMFRDPDGEGGNAPVQFDTIRLSANTTYLSNVILLNETVSPPDTISNEIKQEDDEHLFCYDPLNADVDISRTDSDGTYEVGLESKWRTGMVSNGSVKVTLKHQPGSKNGSCAPGETDIEVDFVTEIQ